MSATLYVETSALLRALLEGDSALRAALLGAERVTSALTFVEAARAISRARREKRLRLDQAPEAARWLAAFERACHVYALDDDVLARARDEMPFEPVRTLDALHLATIRLLDAELGGVSVASCDDRIRRNAEALGFGVVP